MKTQNKIKTKNKTKKSCEPCDVVNGSAFFLVLSLHSLRAKTKTKKQIHFRNRNKTCDCMRKVH